jgi:C_GCAxxG_C_C family probable redox protein
MIISLRTVSWLAASIGDRAVGLFDSGFNCAESVLSVLSDRLGKWGRNCTGAVPCVATGFGGGIGRNGSTCGALSGIVLAIGLAAKRDKASDWDKKYEVYDIVSKTLADFEKRFGSSLCKDLTGYDLRNKEERLRYRSHRVQSKKCSKFVRWCADYGAKLVDSTKEG